MMTRPVTVICLTSGRNGFSTNSSLLKDCRGQQFKLHPRIAKRNAGELTKRGLGKFVSTPRHGYYGLIRIVSSSGFARKLLYGDFDPTTRGAPCHEF